jgi:hypothetical protein
MTSQLHPKNASSHLTDDQFNELLASRRADGQDTPSAGSESDSYLQSAEAHLLACEECAAEFACLRESLSLFRQASSAYAENQLRSVQPRPLPLRLPALQPAYWAAAASIALAALLPMQMMYRHSAAPKPPVTATIPEHSAESDEALLEDVNREVSESVPTPMKALADPTSTTATSVQPSIQRNY